MISLFGDAQQIPPSICFNTDSIFDYMTGELQCGVDGKYYINGGLSPAIAGVMARPNMYKSTFAASIMARVAAIYQQEFAIFDSEDSISRGIDRIRRMAGNHHSKLTSGQILMFDATCQYDIAETEKKLVEIGKIKMEHAKDLTFTTPFPDLRTLKPRKVLAPTLIFLDSLSEMHSAEEDVLIAGKQGLNDSKVKTVYMKDANAKTIFLRKIRRLAVEYGFIIVTTAHYSKQLNMDSYGPTPKQLQWMQQDYSPKNVGSKFLFLTSPQFFVKNCKCLQDDAKECWYKLNKSSSPTDINEIIGEIQRCKNAPSGTTHPFVVSQESGLLADVSDYNYLKSMKNFGLNGNNVTCQCAFTPDVNLTRNSLRGVCLENKQEIRALQLMAQLCYVQNMWNNETVKNTFGFSVMVEPAHVMDFLKSDKNKYTVDRILNSRGYWLPTEIASDEEYMSIFDVLAEMQKVKS